MPNPDRPQAPGYLANLMARLFHEVSGDGLRQLGIAPPLFPLLIDLWFSDSPVTREGLCTSQEMSASDVDALVASMAAAGLIEASPADPREAIKLTAHGESVKGPAIAAARRSNAAAAGALSEEEMAVFLGMMNRVIDALQAARG